MGSTSQPLKIKYSRAVHLLPSGILSYRIDYQASDRSIDIAVYLLREGRLERGAANLLPQKKEDGKLEFRADVPTLLDGSNPGALQMGWQKLIIVLAPMGSQPSARAVMEQINAPLLKKSRKWTYLEHEINIVN
jgi:hypothetical protein